MPKKKTILRDEKIQGTNDSSIVSKRSVEKLYQPKNGPGRMEFYRHFVAKYQRRSPIINRGYWTRMEAMKGSIEQWISMTNTTGRKRVIANLGCGYDPYAFELLHESTQKDVLFLDIDYPDLMKKKVQMLKKSRDLSGIVGEEIKTNGDPHVIFQTKNYICLSCDLRELDLFGKLLGGLFDTNDTDFLFTAEVSITYMTKHTADALIEWIAKNLKYSNFVLLEQIIPGGESHPFAKTMLKHFESLNTPLHSVTTYTDTAKQKQRFHERGWLGVESCNLLDIWQSLPQDKRDFVESIEEFDEWEEFILFCQHYVVVRASNHGHQGQHISSDPYGHHEVGEPISLNNCGKCYHRKFGAGTRLDDSTLLVHGGVDTVRENTSIVISPKDTPFTNNISCSSQIEGRLCHTVTRLDNGDLLLVGGRLNPSRPLKDCWLYSVMEDEWVQVDDLPDPRFRHTAFAYSKDEVVVFGGCVSQQECPWLIWHRTQGWKALDSPSYLLSRNSSSMTWNSNRKCGILMGGMGMDHKFHDDCIRIEIQNDKVTATVLANDSVIQRYGAQAVFIDDDHIIVAGGVSPSKLITEEDFFVEYTLSENKIMTRPMNSELDFLGVGFNIGLIGESIVLYGGGCVCFSFGSFWNEIWATGYETDKLECRVLTASETRRYPELIHETDSEVTQQQFERICRRGVPFIFRRMNLGRCIDNWTWEYLEEKIGPDRQVVVHVSEDSDLNFVSKNFGYKEMSFGKFLSEMRSGKQNVYLRAVSNSSPKEKAAIFSEDFPTIAADVCLPPFAKAIQESLFSSPLRLSSANTSMWLHYDVTANVLCQIRGEKVVRLYPPSDVAKLSFSPGSSSSKLTNVFEISISEHRSQGLHPIETTMRPGDILYIPSLWLHATRPMSESISLNYFWKNLESHFYSAGSDVYGNRDLAAYENGRRVIAKLKESFSKLPFEAREFYLTRLSQELHNSNDM